MAGSQELEGSLAVSTAFILGKSHPNPLVWGSFQQSSLTPYLHSA